jgi:cell division protein FtsA
VLQRPSIRRDRQAPRAPVSFAIVEPGSTTLRLCVVEVADGQSTVLGWAEGPGWSGRAAELSALVNACDEALVEAERMAQASGDRYLMPDQLVVGLPASHLRGRSWAVAQQRPQPSRLVDERELEALLERTLRLAVNRLLSDAPGDGTWLLVDAVPVALTVDGRGVTDLVGFRGQEIGAAVFAATTRAETVQTWGAVAKALEFSAVTLTAAPLALAAGLPVSQGILVDVGGAATDLVWCSAGRPVVTESLPVGGNALTGALAREWGLTAGPAERLKRAYSCKELNADSDTQVQAVLWPALLQWLEDMEVALARLSHDEPLPQHIYLLGGGSALPEMLDAVRSLAWSQRLHFTRYPEVCSLRPTDVPGVMNRSGMGQELGDVSALALASWVAKQQHGVDRPGRILAELCQG